MKKNAQYEIKDEISTIIVTKKFKREASVMNTPEFEVYMTLREKFPTFKIEVREIKKNSNKESYRNLTYANMEILIMELYKDDKEMQKTKMEEYKSMRIIAQIQPAPYAYMKSWFLEKYSETYHKKYNEPKSTATENTDEKAA